MSSTHQSTNSSLMDKTLSLIVAMTKDRVIGLNGKMPWHIKEELKLFKKITMGKSLIMGRVTFESLGSKALVGRKFVVLSKSMSEVTAENCYLAKDIDSAIEIAAKINPDQDEVMVVGGAKVYELFIPKVTKLYISWIKQNYQGDTRFPEVSLYSMLVESIYDSDSFSTSVYSRVK